MMRKTAAEIMADVLAGGWEPSGDPAVAAAVAGIRARETAKRVRLPVPAGFVARRASASGRSGATRWKIYRSDETKPADEWIGDVVRWEPEGTWSSQPCNGFDDIAYPDPARALSALLMMADRR